MPESIAIPTAPKPIHGAVRPPGSKSLTNRALVCAALAKGKSRLTGVLDSVDTRVMAAALATLGIDVVPDWNAATIEVEGCGGQIPATAAEINIENSGTSARFLAATLSLGHGEYRLDGNARMRERPIGDLLEALAQLGTQAESIAGTGCPPVLIHGNGMAGGTATIRGDVSSQFLSGLLLAAPCAQSEVQLSVTGTLVSVPYVTMTLAVMRAFGVDVEPTMSDGVPKSFRVPRATYQCRDYAVEPDASAASYFLAAAAITGGEVTVEGLSRNSLQGDIGFVDCLEQMGCRVLWKPDSVTVAGGKLAGIETDMNAISDTVMTLAAVALFADGPTNITNVAHVRHKETDRLAALTTELRKLGATVDERPDGMTITPALLHGAALDTYDDHRMAMGLALAGLRTPGVVINDPGCTSKTYPRYFDDLFALYA